MIREVLHDVENDPMWQQKADYEDLRTQDAKISQALKETYESRCEFILFSKLSEIFGVVLVSVDSWK